MNIDKIHIIIAFFLLIFIIINTILLVLLKNRNKKAKKTIEKAKNNFLKEKSYLNKEIERQKFIIEKFKNNGNYFKNNKKEISEQNNNISDNENGNNKISKIEKKELSDKNKKMWELSIAIHKEKEKIDKLKKEIEHRHEEVTKSITYAQRIQKALLPTDEQQNNLKYKHFIFWKPRDIVSGDYYWMRKIDNFSIIVMADCTGHGVPGALMSVLGISFLNEIFATGQVIKASEILERMRILVKKALHQDKINDKKNMPSDGMDMAVVVINNDTLEINFAGANNPLYLIRNNELEVFKADRNPVGIHPFEKPFSDYNFKLEKNDRIFMFSDGFIDQFGGDRGRKFLSKNFKKLLLLISNQNFSVEQEKEILNNALKDWIGDENKQIDDILIFGMKV